MENWRKFTNEARKKTGIVDTVRGKEEVPITYELGNFFVYKVTASFGSFNCRVDGLFDANIWSNLRVYFI